MAQVGTPTETINPRLWDAAMIGHVEYVRECLDAGDAVDDWGTFGDPSDPDLMEDRIGMITPLQAVCHGGNCPEVVELLLKAGASVDARGAHGDTSLSYAAYEGCTKTVDLLLRYKADVYSIDNEDCTSIESCVMSPDACPVVVRTLLEYGANVYTDIEEQPNLLSLLDLNDRIEPDVRADIESLIKAEMLTRDKCAAFAMAHQTRLGATSIAERLDPEVLRMIIRMV